MMSDLVKAQNLPQFNWYTCWTSLGANGMPDKLIKEGLKQPDQIKVSFEKGAKDKKQPKEKKTAQLPVACSRESSYRQHRSCKYCNYH